jgi:hypothetical protein
MAIFHIAMKDATGKQIAVTGKAFFDIDHAPANHSNRRAEEARHGSVTRNAARGEAGLSRNGCAAMAGLSNCGANGRAFQEKRQEGRQEVRGELEVIRKNAEGRSPTGWNCSWNRGSSAWKSSHLCDKNGASVDFLVLPSSLFLSQPANPTSFAILFIAANNQLQPPSAEDDVLSSAKRDQIAADEDEREQHQDEIQRVIDRA